MNVKHAENQHMPPNIPKFQVNARGSGEVYGCDIAEIHGNKHLVVVDYLMAWCTFCTGMFITLTDSMMAVPCPVALLLFLQNNNFVTH